MSRLLDLFPAHVPFVDKDGRLTPSALRAMDSLLHRVGGPVALTNSELAITDDDDSGLEEFKGEAAKRFDGLDMEPRPVFEPAQGDLTPPDSFLPFTDPLYPLAQPAEVQQLQTEVAELREEVSRLRTQINDILQGTNL